MGMGITHLPIGKIHGIRMGNGNPIPMVISTAHHAISGIYETLHNV